MKILIVEDERDLLLEIVHFLSKENYLCEIAEDFYDRLFKLMRMMTIKYCKIKRKKKSKYN